MAMELRKQLELWLKGDQTVLWVRRRQRSVVLPLLIVRFNRGEIDRCRGDGVPHHRQAIPKGRNLRALSGHVHWLLEARVCILA